MSYEAPPDGENRDLTCKPAAPQSSRYFRDPPGPVYRARIELTYTAVSDDAAAHFVSQHLIPFLQQSSDLRGWDWIPIGKGKDLWPFPEVVR
jgi:hypothetical protein